MTDAAASASASAPATRTSARVRNKSARALESESTNKMLEAARATRSQEASTSAQSQELAAEGEGSEDAGEKVEEGVATRTNRATRSRRGARMAGPASKPPKKSKWCSCKTHKTGPMIECGECDNWFHFDCVGMTDEEAEKINTWVCAECAERTGAKNIYIYDLEGFPSPAPPSDVEVEDATAPAPKAKAKSKAQAKPKPAPKPKTEPKRKSTRRTAGKTKAEATPEEDAAEPGGKEDTDDKMDVDGEGEEGESASDSDHTEHQSESESDDSGSDAAPTEPESESEAEDAPRRKRARVSKSPVRPPPSKSPARSKSPVKADKLVESSEGSKAGVVKPVPTISTDKRPSIDQRRSSNTVPKTPTTPGALPAARQYIITQLSKVVAALFGDKKDAAASEAYAREVEAAMFSHFKEVVNGKEVAGNRYKGQFTLLNGSLGKAREEIKAKVIDGTFTPAKVAIFNSEDVATEQQFAEILAARAESLRQTVRKDNEYVSVRVGRDGFEDVEQKRDDYEATEAKEKEAEEAPERARTPRAVGVTPPPQSPRSPKSPKTPLESPKSPVHRRRSSVSIYPPSPVAVHRPSVEFSSAWGTGAQASDADLDTGDQDQEGIDLSDLTNEVAYDDGLDGAVEADPMGEFLARPVVWSGGITNPAEESPHTPPIQMRLAAGRATHPAEYFRHLLNSQTIAIAGRVPSASSLQYLSDRRFDRTKDLVTVALTLDPAASEEERAAWTAIVEFHVKRDRHAIYHPPAGSPARELYLVPLRAGDAMPEFFDMLDAFALPKESRGAPVLVGVFIAQRDSPVRSPADAPPVARPSPPIQAQLPHQPPPQPQAPQSPAPTGPAFPNAQLQALMASLNPAAISAATAPRPQPPQAPSHMPVPPFPPGPTGYRPDHPPTGPAGYWPDQPQAGPAGYSHDHPPTGPAGYTPDHPPTGPAGYRQEYRPVAHEYRPHRPDYRPPPFPQHQQQRGYHAQQQGRYPHAQHARPPMPPIQPPRPGGYSPADGVRSPQYGHGGMPPRGGGVGAGRGGRGMPPARGRGRGWGSR